jgi:NAD(P)-dependent dehydrogenase (short-subunit alcohol dehydrogenase family)
MTIAEGLRSPTSADDRELGGRVAIVTGGASGMGLATAHALARRGATVAVLDLAAPGRTELASTLAVAADRVRSVAVDVTDGDQVHRAFASLLGERSRLDVLVNAAGIASPTAFDDITEDEWTRVLAVNVHGTFLCCQRALPAMRRGHWGRIVNFSSTAGKTVSTAGGAHYTTAKHAVCCPKGRSSASPGRSRCPGSASPGRLPSSSRSSPPTGRRTSRVRPSTSTAAI